ncbi:ABC transporter ATP-binding protein [Siminovitchia sediminis]|uniref:ABC transporter ATP-binding protein n=1 Tax=Siminovitchia sediminis TaxID=1274353 RepID=A0ABW4KNM0_9BACI
MDTVVEIDRLTKVFRQKKAVDDVSFSIRKGEITAILGPNGAGKTTTMLMMLGLLKPTEGKVLLFQQHPKERFVRENLGVMLQEVSLMDAIKVKELIQLFRSYYPQPMGLDQLVTLTGLSEEDLNRRTEKLSGGQKRRVAFALALAGNPELLFFDEPTVGMDNTSRRLFWKTVRGFARQGKTIIFTTHYLQEADEYADRIILFKEGKVAADGTPDTIKKELTRQFVSFISPDEIPADLFLQMPFVSDVYEQEGRTYIISDDTDSVLFMMFEKKLFVQDIRVEKGSLDEAFEHLTIEEKEAI